MSYPEKWYSCIISEHYCTHVVPQELVAVVTKSPQIKRHVYYSPTGLSINGLSGAPIFSISDYTAPPIYLSISKMPWQLAMNVGVEEIVLPTHVP